MEILKKIKSKQIKVAVIGLGYVGLPLAIAIANSGYNVFGIDYSEDKVDKINSGISDIDDIKDEVLEPYISNKIIQAYKEYKVINQCRAIIICVPTPLDKAKAPDLNCINMAMNEIIKYVKKGTIIVLESTTYPGTTKELIVNRIEKEKGWKVGTDFYVCYSPERVDPGNREYMVENTPKVIGGATPMCLEIGKTLYESFINEVIGVSTTEIAEMSKLLENTFRCINIALVNEMAIMCGRMGINIWEVIRGASTKPFGFKPFYPGPGVGGHCIPLDPLYLSWKAKEYNYFNRFIELASDINSNMPYYIVSQIVQILDGINKSISMSRVLILGMSYKKDISDLRESPSLEIYEILKAKNIQVDFYDSYVASFRDENDDLINRIELNETKIKEYDIIAILTDHSNIDYEWLKNQNILIYDTRDVYKGEVSDNIKKLGVL